MLFSHARNPSARRLAQAVDRISTNAHHTFSAKLWRAVRVFLGAWALVVAGVTVVSVVLYVFVGLTSLEPMRYAVAVLFLLGIFVMHRWLK